MRALLLALALVAVPLVGEREAAAAGAIRAPAVEQVSRAEIVAEIFYRPATPGSCSSGPWTRTIAYGFCGSGSGQYRVNAYGGGHISTGNWVWAGTSQRSYAYHPALISYTIIQFR